MAKQLGSKNPDPWRAVYDVATDVWKGATWVWTAIVIAVLVGVASQVFAGTVSNAFGTAIGK